MSDSSTAFINSTERLQQLRSQQQVRKLTLEECREVLRIMRGDRVRAAASSATSRAKKAPINSDDLLKGLE